MESKPESACKVCLCRLSLLGGPNRVLPEQGLWFPEMVLFSKEGRFDILRPGHEIKSLRLTLFASDYAIMSFQTWFTQAFYVTHFKALRRFLEHCPFCLVQHMCMYLAISEEAITCACTLLSCQWLFLKAGRKQTVPLGLAAIKASSTRPASVWIADERDYSKRDIKRQKKCHAVKMNQIDQRCGEPDPGQRSICPPPHAHRKNFILTSDNLSKLVAASLCL